MNGPAPAMHAAPNRLDGLIASGCRLLVGYFPAGDPMIPVEMIDIYAGCGVDILEIGIKADDPFMDGAAVSASMARSHGRGMLEDARAAIARLDAGRHRIATLAFAYYNAFAALPRANAWRGMDGLLGLPASPERTDVAMRANARANGVRVAEFVPFSFGPADIERARNAEAYVMLQAADGKTGARDTLDAGCARRIAALRTEGVTASIVLGFGISRPEHAAQAIEMGANGIVVGSRCVDKCLDGAQALADFLGEMRSRLDG